MCQRRMQWYSEHDYNWRTGKSGESCMPCLCAVMANFPTWLQECNDCMPGWPVRRYNF